MAVCSSLFDDMKRTDASPRQDEEPFLAYLNRSAHPDAAEIRARLESWFKRFPAEAQGDVFGRLRADEDKAYQGAVFELFIHELLTRLGCVVKAHPTIPDTEARPDFLAFCGNRCFYVEAKVVDPRTNPFACNPLEADVIAKINSLTSPEFHILAQVDGKLTRALAGYQVVQPFRDLLAACDPEEVQRLIDRGGPFAAPSAVIESGSWSLQGWLQPIVPERRDNRPRTLVIGPARTEAIDSATPVQRAIRQKAGKYGRLDAPFVVAVNVRDPFFDEDDELEALFGKERIVYSEECPALPPKLSRKPDGVWIQGGHKPRYARLTAVLAFLNFVPWNLRNIPACLYVNPFASNTKLPDVLYRLSHARAHKREIHRYKGESIGQLLEGDKD